MVSYPQRIQKQYHFSSSFFSGVQPSVSRRILLQVHCKYIRPKWKPLEKFNLKVFLPFFNQFVCVWILMIWNNNLLAALTQELMRAKLILIYLPPFSWWFCGSCACARRKWGKRFFEPSRRWARDWEKNGWNIILFWNWWNIISLLVCCCWWLMKREREAPGSRHQDQVKYSFFVFKNFQKQANPAQRTRSALLFMGIHVFVFWI